MAVSIKECLELQLLEMEMLFSMFSNKGEINLRDQNAVTCIQLYLKNTKEELPPQIDYSVSVNIDKPKVKVDLQVILPHTYPYSAPQLFARSNALDREQQLQLNKHLTSHVSSLNMGELCICTALQWIQDNTTPYFQKRKVSFEAPKEKALRRTFHRMWIYSRHIYRQELRKKIFDCAKQLNLTGFCLTGKPGIICVERIENCEEFWHVSRYPNWKHITCKHVENIETQGNGDNLRLFTTFEDLQFQAHGDYGLRNDYHMDLGQFLEFLKQHQREHVFRILFGVEGKQTTKSSSMNSFNVVQLNIKIIVNVLHRYTVIKVNTLCFATINKKGPV